MSIPAVGVIVAMAYVAVIDEQERFHTIQHSRRLAWLDSTPLPVRRCRLRGARLAKDSVRRLEYPCWSSRF